MLKQISNSRSHCWIFALLFFPMWLGTIQKALAMTRTSTINLCMPIQKQQFHISSHFRCQNNDRHLKTHLFQKGQTQNSYEQKKTNRLLLAVNYQSEVSEGQSSLLSVRANPARKGWLVATGRAAGFIAGAWAAALAHELGHALVVWGYNVTGENYRFEWPAKGEARHELLLPYWKANGVGKNDGHRRNIASGGFVFSAAISEVMIFSDWFPKSDVFVGGFLFYDLLNAVAYIARDVAAGGGKIGDIRDMDKGGWPRSLVYTILLTRSALVLARVLENPDFMKLSYWWDSSQPY